MIKLGMNNKRTAELDMRNLVRNIVFKSIVTNMVALLYLEIIPDNLTYAKFFQNLKQYNKHYIELPLATVNILQK